MNNYIFTKTKSPVQGDMCLFPKVYLHKETDSLIIMEPVRLRRGVLLLNNRAFTLDIFHNFRSKSALVGETHLGGESGGRHPFGGIAGVGLFQHPVDLFQCETLGLRDQEIGIDEAAGAKRAPDEEDLGAKVAFIRPNHIRCDDGNDLTKPISGDTTMNRPGFYDLRSSKASWRRWKDQHRGNGLEEGRSLQ